MKRNALILLSATACILAGCSQKEATTSDTTTTVTANGTDVTTNTADVAAVPENAPAATVSEGQGFANAAGASDAFEIESSKLAATNGASAAVKNFATQMITAHTGSTAELTGLATKLVPAITPDPTLSADQDATLTALKSKQGAAFDTAYVAAQVDAHDKALATLKAYAATGAVPEFKTFAAGLVPKVTAHLNMAKGLKP